MTNADSARERDILAKAYNIIDDLTAQAPEANFPEVVEGAQKNRIFHDILAHVEEMGITRATFVAVHALAQCADALDEISEGDLKGLNDQLYEAVRQSLGDDIYDHLREWMSGVRMDDEQLEHSTPWAKLGAMSRSLEVAGAFASDSVQFSQQGADVVSGIVASQERVAHAFKDLGSLYNYYTGRIEEIVRAAEKQPTIRANGPGFNPS